MDNYEFLSKYFTGTEKINNPSSLDTAKFILLNAQQRKPLGPGTIKANPSIAGRIFDLLSRSNYAVANSINESLKDFKDKNLKKALIKTIPKLMLFDYSFWEGVSGRKKTTFKDVLETVGVKPGIGTGIGGLALDILGDPLTYVPFGVLATGSKAAVKTAVTLDKTKVQRLLSKGEPVHPELFGLQGKERIIPEALKKTPTGITAPVDQIPSIPLLDKAPLILDKVAKGDLLSNIRITPKLKPNIEVRHQKIADSILETWNPKLSNAILNKQFPDSLNAKQQILLYYKALEQAKKGFKNPNSAVNVKRVDSNAFKIYLALEKTLESRGFIPRIGTGENIKLSDVVTELGGSSRAKEILDEFGSTIKEGSPTWQAIQALKSRGAIEDSKSVEIIAEAISDSKGLIKASNVKTNSELLDFENFLKNFGVNIAKLSNISPASTRATGDIIEVLIKGGKSPALSSTEQKSRLIGEVLSSGKINPELNKYLTLALEKDLGTLPKWAVDNKATEFLMGRVATWWGQEDLRPFSLSAIGSNLATCMIRGKVLDNIFKPYSLDQRLQAMKSVQGFQTGTDEVTELSNQINRLMSNLVDPKGSVLSRSGIPMQSLNKWVKFYGLDPVFTNKSIKTITGETVDFSKGTDWLNSWKALDIEEDPKIWMFKLQQAVEQATREKALFDELGERFGALSPGNSFNNKIIGYPYIEKYYFPREIAVQIPRVIKDWSIPAFKTSNPLIKQYDRVLSMWKAGVTIYRPGHHIRNMVGDVYLGWMDGVNTLKPYQLAVRTQRFMKNSYKDLINIDQLVDLKLLPKTLSTPHSNDVLFHNRSGVPFKVDQIVAAAHNKGLFEHAKTLEDLIDIGESSKFKPFGGKVQGVARGASELQSHNTRLAHFIDKIMKSRGSNLEDIFEQAARRARKWHPSGLDLTQFEKTYLRRLIPFYSWIRKSTPLLIEGLLMNPGKAVIPSKIFDSIQTSQGIETPNGRSDPFPIDQMFPDWIRSEGVGPVGIPSGLLGSFSNQQPPGYVMAGAGLNPLTQLLSQVESPGRTIATSLTPGIQIPMELLTGRKAFTQEPITGPEARPGALQQYIGEQLPVVKAVQGVTGLTPFGTETKYKSQTGTSNKEALINWLTASGIRSTGPYIKQARYETLSPGKLDKKINKEQFLNELRRRLEDGNS